ncbi:MAG: MTH938/NDUFAF3 family protein [Pseudomonadota bacterium]
MKFTREQAEGLYTVHAYQSGSVTLNSPDPADARDEEGRIVLTESFIVSPRHLMREWRPDRLEQIEGRDLGVIAEFRPEILLLGTGESLLFPNNSLTAAIIELGVGYEIMSSPAACRTYNLLAAEGRRVAAAIIIEN